MLKRQTVTGANKVTQMALVCEFKSIDKIVPDIFGTLDRRIIPDSDCVSLQNNDCAIATRSFIDLVFMRYILCIGQ